MWHPGGATLAEGVEPMHGVGRVFATTSPTAVNDSTTPAGSSGNVTGSPSRSTNSRETPSSLTVHVRTAPDTATASTSHGGVTRSSTTPAAREYEPSARNSPPRSCSRRNPDESAAHGPPTCIRPAASSVTTRRGASGSCRSTRPRSVSVLVCLPAVSSQRLSGDTDTACSNVPATDSTRRTLPVSRSCTSTSCTAGSRSLPA
ncbi:hypothetical protein A6A25_33835 [Saccharothrix sp. CB00851]|nr:hypothetical protein A6A25_33835 [Saccharothrix sp. CB00851]